VSGELANRPLSHRPSSFVDGPVGRHVTIHTQYIVFATRPTSNQGIESTRTSRMDYRFMACRGMGSTSTVIFLDQLRSPASDYQIYASGMQ
jgi:hypothetical protein